MASSSKRKQTMAKVARERALQERRELKAQKKEDRKRAAAERSDEIAYGIITPEDIAAEEAEAAEASS